METCKSKLINSTFFNIKLIEFFAILKLIAPIETNRIPDIFVIINPEGSGFNNLIYNRKNSGNIKQIRPIIIPRKELINKNNFKDIQTSYQFILLLSILVGHFRIILR